MFSSLSLSAYIQHVNYNPHYYDDYSYDHYTDQRPPQIQPLMLIVFAHLFIHLLYDLFYSVSLCFSAAVHCDKYHTCPLFYGAVNFRTRIVVPIKAQQKKPLLDRRGS